MKRIVPLIDRIAASLGVFRRQTEITREPPELVDFEALVNRTIEQIMTASNSPKNTLRLVEVHTETGAPRGTFMCGWNTTTRIKIAATNAHKNKVFVYSAEAVEILEVEQKPVPETWITILSKIKKDEVLFQFLEKNPEPNHVDFVRALLTA